MRLRNTLVALSALFTLAYTESVRIQNHLSYPIWTTQVTADGSRGDTQFVDAYSFLDIEQSDAYGVAIKITPEEEDIDTAGKGVLILGYNKHPDGWIYYDLGVHLYYPFPGVGVKLVGPGGDNDWSDGQAHPQNTKGYHGPGDLWLDIGY